ncbi:MAG: superoxide dismutase family protein [Clostridia bacterium]|nr:superoxide dismutase family protein [Clostridia bacterium]
MNENTCNSMAFATIRGGNQAPNIYGQVSFLQKRNYVLVTTHIRGLPETASGFFGFHIHEGMSCKGTAFSNTKNHYNPTNLPHPSHAGDLPPLMYYNGCAYQSFKTDRFCVNDIIGRTIVIHDMPDDFNTQPSGNSGTKIACGVICAG